MAKLYRPPVPTVLILGNGGAAEAEEELRKASAAGAIKAAEASENARDAKATEAIAVAEGPAAAPAACPAEGGAKAADPGTAEAKPDVKDGAASEEKKDGTADAKPEAKDDDDDDDDEEGAEGAGDAKKEDEEDSSGVSLDRIVWMYETESGWIAHERKFSALLETAKRDGKLEVFCCCTRCSRATPKPRS